MVSGADVVGIVLAVLPLVIQGAQVYMHGVEDIRDAVVAHRHDDSLQDFYELFLVEITLLKGQLIQAIDALAGVSELRKAELLKDLSFQPNDWEPSGEIAEALENFYGPSYELFIVVVNKIMRLISHLIRDKSVQVEQGETVCISLC